MSAETLHILLVDDDENHVELIRHAFGKKFNCSIASTLTEAQKFLKKTMPDLMIVDFLLPDGEGLELLPGKPEKQTIPIIILTGQGDEKVATTAIKNGAMDYIVKSAETFADMQHIVERTLREWQHITERKQAEEMVKKLSRAMEQAGESIVITDREGVIEHVNPAFTKFTGYSAEEAIGQTPRILKSGNQNASFYDTMWETITCGKVWHGKVIDRRKDGSFYPAMLTISPIFDASGDLTHFVGSQSDLTELESLAQQFHQAQKMEEIGTLVGGIAHDFNNMLAGITGNLYLAKQDAKQLPDVVKRLVRIEQISLRAADMIQQLLTFARKGMVSMKEIPFTPFIKETLKLQRTSVPENIAMHQYICTDFLQIRGDATQLHQILMNLVNNARDAVEGGDKPCISIRLEAFYPDDAFIETHADSTNKAYAHLSVEDNGCGIPEDQIEHLFEPFFTTKEQGKGTGLGLAMVFGAITTHQGFVEAESKKGKGSTFHIYIPLLEPKEITSASVQGKETTRGHGEMILLADDEAHILETTREVLGALGYKVVTATNGREAVEIFEASSESIALCIFDIVMPVMNGDKAAQSIRRIAPHAKIIFSTGYDKNTLSRMEDETVLTKPFSIEKMSHMIRQHLNPDSQK